MEPELRAHRAIPSPSLWGQGCWALSPRAAALRVFTGAAERREENENILEGKVKWWWGSVHPLCRVAGPRCSGISPV